MNAFDVERPFNAPRTWTGRAAFAAIGWVERRISQWSAVGTGSFFDPECFPWAVDLRRGWPHIAEEARLLLEGRDELPAFHEISREVGYISKDRNWKTFMLMGYGLRSERNLRACPQTAAILAGIPAVETALFSILEPGKRLPVHRGPYNGVLRVHLALVVPQAAERCWIRVGGERRTWARGQLLIFDDSLPHEVHNDTDEIRVVLFLDVVRPCRWPVSWINSLLIFLARFSPLVQSARRNQLAWERRRYGRAGASSTPYTATTADER